MCGVCMLYLLLSASFQIKYTPDSAQYNVDFRGSCRACDPRKADVG